MKRYSFIMAVLACFFGLNTEAQDLDKLKNLKARSIGPAGMSGRVTSIDVERKDPDHIIIGTASGGVWESDNGGVKWNAIFDEQEILNIGAVAIQQSNPDVIWVGTGEGNPRNSQSSGAGIYKSIDGGLTWKLMGLENTKTIHRIIIHPNDPNTVYVAAMGSAWGPNKERGLYKTINGGENWEKILYVNDTTGCADLVIDPENPNKLIAGMWQYLRKPWFFESGGNGSGLYLSYDGGKSWKKKNESHGLPEGEIGRIGLAIAPSKPEVVYALIEAKITGLYRSNDGGEHWKLVSTENIGNRPFYYADIYVDTKNENRLYNLYSLVSQSEDGGKSFRVILPYSGVHPDHQAFYIHPDDPSYMINGNDGGLNISRDGGKTWRFVENLPLGQFYHINVDNDLPYNIYGGLQDNGSWVGPAYKWQQGGMRNSDWQELLFGDGFDVLPYLSNSRYGFAMYQGGNVYRYDRETGNNLYVQPFNDTVELRFNWNAAIARDPFEDSTVYFGSQFVHKSKDLGENWDVISPDLSTNDTSKQKQAKSGGLTIDATRAENFTSILSIAPSPLEKGMIWAGTDDGKLHLTKDGGKSWTDLSAKLKAVPKGSWLPQIRASKHKANRVFVVVNNYRRNDWKPYLLRSDDAGASFKNILEGSKVKGYALSVIEDPEVEDLLFLGTEQGLWLSFDAGQSWKQWKYGVPSASVMDMALQERESDLVLGTFGRAIFVLDDIEILRDLARSGAEVLEKDLVVFDPPVAYVHDNMPARGVRFTADAHYRGQNRRGGAMITTYLKEGAQKSKGSKKKNSNKDKLKLDIYQDQNLIRTQYFRADTGVNRVYWDMRHDGVRMPQHSKLDKDRALPGGILAKEGKYTVVVSYKEWSDTTQLSLKYAPQKQFSEVAWNKMRENAKLVHGLIDTAASSFEQLKEMEKSMQDFRKVFMSKMDTARKKEFNTQLDSLSKEIVELKTMYRTAKDFKGYDHVSQFINNYLSRARSLAYQSMDLQGSDFERSLNKAKTSLFEAQKAQMNFIQQKWNPFIDEIEQLELSPFKKY